LIRYRFRPDSHQTLVSEVLTKRETVCVFGARKRFTEIVMSKTSAPVLALVLLLMPAPRGCRPQVSWMRWPLKAACTA